MAECRFVQKLSILFLRGFASNKGFRKSYGIRNNKFDLKKYKFLITLLGLKLGSNAADSSFIIVYAKIWLCTCII